MLRTAASRGLLRSLTTTSTLPVRTAIGPQGRSKLCTVARRPQLQAVAQPTISHTLRLVRQQTDNRGPVDKVDRAQEAKIGAQKLPVDPAGVSTQSTIHPVLGEVGGTGDAERQTEMLAGVKHDIKTIQETFNLEGVPKEAYYIGLAGVIPYVATSLSTVYCAYEIHRASEVGTSLMINEKTAELLLHVLEPLQIGYGATIISFLGAIHWGLEWAAYGGTQGYPRYAIGVIATGLAWPTILLPVEYALISQFLIFNFLYYNDSRASKRGWAPSWYPVYRFVLTFIVGSSIVVSLIGRGQIADRIEKPSGPADRILQLGESQLGPEDEATRKKLLSEGDDEEDAEESEDEE